MMQLDGYTVDYIEAVSANLMAGMDLQGGRCVFLFLTICHDTLLYATANWYFQSNLILIYKVSFVYYQMELYLIVNIICFSLF